jgi:hypothetical protein
MKVNYDFSGGVRGKYHKQYCEGTNLVALDPDIGKHFPDSESVNFALRAIIDAYKHPKAVKAAHGAK